MNTNSDTAPHTGQESKAFREAVVGHLRRELVALRTERDLSGRSLDRILGWARGNWSKLEAGRAGGLTIPLDIQLQIEQYFGLKPGELLRRAVEACELCSSSIEAA